ncbi:HAMP domain-containing histidine kinase [Paenibacillus tritici]|uniref:sensor histidine kinase n=1 Tax=Paenibacillus tritici TaxID=1873425 RepID=UPI001BAAD6BE|nr:ATP-binding protein [Paenibacillus tritici]QUL53500.1 HAMP domain-containing histidine kinase [Paenibacillus tritici]
MLSTLKGLWFWRKSIVWKIMIINGIVIGMVIWLVGVSVKDFACLLVEQYSFVEQEKQHFFNQTMHFYLLRASLIALLVAAVIYYLLMRKIQIPLHQLMKSTRLMNEGKYPEPLPVASEDETGQLSHQFNQMILTLSRSEESRKQMFSNISHELRTPLSNLNGYLEALSTGVIQGNAVLYRSLHDEALHLSKLVEQLHQLAVWENRRFIKPQWQKIDIHVVIQTVYQSFDLELRNVQMNVEFEVSPAVVEGDEVGLRQVVTNLLQNALQYDLGGWIRITGDRVEKEYRVTITNAGQPIPPEKIPFVFERLYRADSARQRGTGGTGLGLAIAKEIVQQHGGRIGLSPKGDEYTFWFTIPLSL